jgi:hypothetical protein
MPFLWRSPFKQVSGPLTIANGGTGAANIVTAGANLSEAGTFTPTLSAVSVAPTSVTLSISHADYVKFGTLVHFHLAFSITSVGSSGSGTIIIGGLPYPSYSSALQGPYPVVTQGVDWVAATPPRAFINGGSVGASALALFEASDNAAGAYMAYSALANSDSIFITGTYITN